MSDARHQTWNLWVAYAIPVLLILGVAALYLATTWLPATDEGRYYTAAADGNWYHDAIVFEDWRAIYYPPSALTQLFYLTLWQKPLNLLLLGVGTLAWWLLFLAWRREDLFLLGIVLPILGFALIVPRPLFCDALPPGASFHGPCVSLPVGQGPNHVCPTHGVPDERLCWQRGDSPSGIHTWTVGFWALPWTPAQLADYGGPGRPPLRIDAHRWALHEYGSDAAWAPSRATFCATSGISCLD